MVEMGKVFLCASGKDTTSELRGQKLEVHNCLVLDSVERKPHIGTLDRRARPAIEERGNNDRQDVRIGNHPCVKPTTGAYKEILSDTFHRSEFGRAFSKIRTMRRNIAQITSQQLGGVTSQPFIFNEHFLFRPTSALSPEIFVIAVAFYMLSSWIGRISHPKFCQCQGTTLVFENNHRHPIATSLERTLENEVCNSLFAIMTKVMRRSRANSFQVDFSHEILVSIIP